MLRPSFAALVLLAGLTPAFAQTPAPAQPQITIDPSVAVGIQSGPVNLLTGLYATLATIEACNIQAPEPAATAMSAHRQALETELRLDQAAAQAAFDGVKADVAKAGMDCAEGSADRQGTQAVIDVYNGTGAAAPATPPAAPPAQ